MPKSPKAKLSAERAHLRFQGLIVHIGEKGDNQEIAQEVLAQIAQGTLPGSWRIHRLGTASLDYLLIPQQARSVTPGTAWEWTMKLRRRREVYDAEPAFVLPGLSPDKPGRMRLKKTLGPASSSSSSDRHLPGSADYEWSLKLCHVPAAWDFSNQSGRPERGAGIIVAHPDTGYTKHPEIDDAVRLQAGSGYDFYQNQKDPRDDLQGDNPGHGTSTASVIMSTQGVHVEAGAAFVTGTAPRASLVPLRVSDSVVHFSFTNVISAIYYAVERGFHLVSMSLGGPWGSAALHRAVQYAVTEDVILLAAAGNVWPWVVYPAKYPEVIAVTACNANSRIWKDSATGEAVDVTAPGESVWRARTAPGHLYQVDRSSGTSYAVATTAGICALWLAHHGRDALIAKYGKGTLAGVLKELLVTQGVTTPTGWNRTKWGAGIVHAEALLKALPPDSALPAGVARIHASGIARRKNDFDEIADYFPELTPDRVRVALRKLFGTTERELNVLLSEIGDEFRFHLATNVELRASIMKRTGARLFRSQPPTATPQRLLNSLASTTLKRRLASR